MKMFLRKIAQPVLYALAGATSVISYNAVTHEEPVQTTIQQVVDSQWPTKRDNALEKLIGRVSSTDANEIDYPSIDPQYGIKLRAFRSDDFAKTKLILYLVNPKTNTIVENNGQKIGIVLHYGEGKCFSQAVNEMGDLAIKYSLKKD